MRWPHALVYLYGLLNLALGIQARFFPSPGHKASTVSLIAGGTAGLIILYFAATVPKNPRLSYIGTTVIALILGVKFMVDYLAKHLMYPGGLMMIASFAVVILLSAAHFSAKVKSGGDPQATA